MRFTRRPRIDLADKVAVVTGAGSGIGRALALELTARGAHVAISDWDPQRLGDTADLLEGRATKVATAELDVSDRVAFEAYAQRVLDEFGRVDVVINNAGVSLSATVANITYDDLEWVMNIDFWGVVHGTKAFLPHLLERDTGAVVNVSSIFGMFGVPTQSGYNAAKFAVRGFTEALQQEVAGTNVVVTRVHPGGVRTGIVRHGRIREPVDPRHDTRDLADRFDSLARTSPHRAARIILDGVERRRSRVLVGADALVLDAVVRAFPVAYQRLVRRFTGDR